jgi:hypothetical protein
LYVPKAAAIEAVNAECRPNPPEPVKPRPALRVVAGVS